MESMTDEEKTEFHAQVGAHASNIVRALLKDMSAPDAAFALGAACKLVAGYLNKTAGMDMEEAEGRVQQAIVTGFNSTKAEVIILDQQP